jgi:hypothetical protein
MKLFLFARREQIKNFFGTRVNATAKVNPLPGRAVPMNSGPATTTRPLALEGLDHLLLLVDGMGAPALHKGHKGEGIRERRRASSHRIDLAPHRRDRPRIVQRKTGAAAGFPLIG